MERRRRWSDEEKLALLRETTEPGAIQAAIARRHDIGTGQLYTCRKQLLRGATAGFVPVELAKAEVARKPRGGGKIAIVSGSGFKVCVDGLVDRAALKLVLDAVGEIAR